MGIYRSKRQPSMSSKMPAIVPSSGDTAPPKWDSKPNRKTQPPKPKIDIPSVASAILHSQSENDSWHLFTSHIHFSSGHQQRNDATFPPSTGGVSVANGLTHLSVHSGSRAKICQLDPLLFNMYCNPLASDPGYSNSGNELTEKNSARRSRLHRCSSSSGNFSGNLYSQDQRFDILGNDLNRSPVSTLDCLQSPASDVSGRGNLKGKSSRCRSDDVSSDTTAYVAPIDSNNSQPRTSLAQYLLSVNSALNGDTADDDDFHGPSDAAWTEIEEDVYHSDLPIREGCASGRVKKEKSSCDCWSSGSSSWSLSLVPKPLRNVSTMVSKKHILPTTSPGPSTKKGVRRGKDAVMPISLATCCNGGSARSRSEVEGTRSGRSWWPELESGRKSVWVPSSGQLQMDVEAEPDLLEPDMEQANGAASRLNQDARVKVDEDDFSFDNPMAAAFVFQEDMCHGLTDSRVPVGTDALHNSAVSTKDSYDLQYGDNHHYSEDASSTDGEASYMCLDGEEQMVLLDQSQCGLSSWSVDNQRDVVDSIGLSSRVVSSLTAGALSRYLLEMGKSGRFSIDLQRGLKLDKARHSHTSNVRLELFNSENSLRCSVLTPCLPFLHKTDMCPEFNE